MKRILAVDDDPAILKMEERLLREEGYDVATAPNGPAAMQAYDREAFDLILLDIMMPGRTASRSATTCARQVVSGKCQSSS